MREDKDKDYRAQVLTIAGLPWPATMTSQSRETGRQARVDAGFYHGVAMGSRIIGGTATSCFFLTHVLATWLLASART